MYELRLAVIVITFPASDAPALNHQSLAPSAVSLSGLLTAGSAVGVVPVEVAVSVGEVVPVAGTAATLTRTVSPDATPAGIVMARLVLSLRPLSAFAPVT
jgi:hypothetical protein